MVRLQVRTHRTGLLSGQTVSTVARVISPPVFETIDSYGSRLGDVAYWRPYVEAALASSGLSDGEMVSGFVGTYPTFVGERLVVKLFGCFPGWRESADAEVAANRAIENDDGISAPKIVALGSLFPGDQEGWPFVIMERQHGRAWREAEPGAEAAGSVASQLGGQIRRLHDLETAHPLDREDWIAAQGENAAERHRTWASLPAHLIDQIPTYLGHYRGGRRCLVHGDLTEDHLFVSGDRLLGIIDWGDAMITDPFYELGALHLGAFAGDRRLLGRFLTGYGWRLDEDFADHALQVALMHEFDLFGSIARRAQAARSLAALATDVWTPMF
jgi:aminoglycoside phosphotransferase (APT) family kinase protein